MTIDSQALHKAADHINRALGDIGKLDSELTNTIANIYYRFYSYCPSEVRTLVLTLVEGPVANAVHATSQQLVLQQQIQVMQTLFEQNLTPMSPGQTTECAFLAASIQMLPKMLSLMEGAKRTANERDMKMVTEVLVNIFKYRIFDALMQPLFKSRIERMFKVRPSELPGLAQQMGFRC
jgi:hypothetical protein